MDGSFNQYLRCSIAIAALFMCGVVMAAPVDIHQADAPALSRAPSGVGIKLSRRIVAYRQQHGRFARTDDLQEVPYAAEVIWERNAK